jgi:phosphate acetyltransferase
MPVLEAEAPVGRSTHEKFHQLVEKAQQHAPMKVAVAHPCDQISLESAVAAAKVKLIEPILVGLQRRRR